MGPTVVGLPRQAPPPTRTSAPGSTPRSTPSDPLPSRRRGWRGLLHSTRFRVLLSFVVLLSCSAVLSLVAVRQVLVLRLEARLDAAMEQEMQELDRLLADGRDPETGQPFSSLAAAFDIYLARNVPSAEEGMLAFVGNDLHQAALSAFPLPAVPAPLLDSIRSQTEPTVSGTYATFLGEARYRADRISFGDDEGAFAVTILPVAEMHELNGLLTWGLAAAAGVLVVAMGFAWPVAGRALAPVRELTETARSISESHLNRRIQVRGSGEAADMAHSFNAMLDRLEAVLRSQRKFVQDASHELRDPLTIVRGHLEVLEDTPAERQRSLELVLDEVGRMARIVADLQVLADVEQPDFLRPALLDLRAFTSELLAKVRMLGDRDWQLDAEGHGFVVADRHRLTEAVTNLAHNAVQHTGPGDVVAIGTAWHGDRWRLWVRDTGVGVAEQDRDRVFERFTRGTGAARRYQGAGLGLSIVAAVARAHGGTVELDTELGAGSTFALVLPARRDGTEP